MVHLRPITQFLPMYTYEFTTAALITLPSPMKTWSPIWRGKNATPLLNFLKGGLMTALLEITQCLPTLTLARSPLMMASDCTMFFPLRMMFWDPQRTLALDTRLPLAVSIYSALLKWRSGNSISLVEVNQANISL